MKEKIQLVAITLAYLLGISVLLAALIRLDAPMPLKIIIAGVFLILYLIFHFINRLEVQLHKINYFVRCNYIANEMSRFDPSDRRPAKEILASDIADEIGYKEADDLVMSRVPFNICFSLVFIVLIAVCTFFIYQLL